MKFFNSIIYNLIYSKIIYISNLLYSFNYKRLLKFIKSKKYLLLFCILITLLIRTICSIYTFNYKYVEDKYSKNMNLLILKQEKVEESYISYLVKLESEESFKDKFILYIYKDKKIITDEDIQLYYTSYGNFKYGDIIKVKGKIVIPKTLNNLHEFDYKKYLNSNNIIGTISTYDADKVSNIKDNFFGKIYKFKERLGNIINSKFPEKEANLFKSMVYGEDANLNLELKTSFTKLGLSHILAVSGSNIGIIVYILYCFFNKFKFNKYISALITCLVIFSFCSIVDFELSLIRASIIAIISLMKTFTSIKFNKFFSITLAFVLIYMINPFYIFNVSFILSFSAFLGILLFSKQLNSLFNIYIVKLIGINNVISISNGNNKGYLKIVYNLLKYISSILAMFFSVQILIFPIQIYYFNSFPIISIFTNIVISIFVTVQLILGYLFILFSYIPYLVDIFSHLNYLILCIVIQIVELFSTFNAFEVNLVKPNLLCFICYYILVVCIFYGYIIEYNLKYMLKKVNIKLVINVLCFFAVIYIIYFNIYTTYISSFVYYFNVEQGNMALVKSGRKVVLVDMGSTSNVNFSGILYNFLKAYNIDKIDYAIITHLHSDHVSGLFKLEEKLESSEIQIGAVIYSIPKITDIPVNNNFTERSVNYLEFENYLNRMKIKQIMVERWDEIRVDKNLKIHILSPKDKEIIHSKDIVNSNSIITIVSMHSYNYLFMGDSTIESEKVLLKDIADKKEYIDMLRNINVVSIGHHGSNTSSSENFIKSINAKFAVISSKKSVYGHPSPVVLKLFEKYNIPTKITEEKGGIMAFP